jgi:hypothetical protein
VGEEITVSSIYVHSNKRSRKEGGKPNNFWAI